MKIQRYIKALYNIAVNPRRLAGGGLVHLQIEPTTHCNIRCASCPREQAIEGRPAHMPLERFTGILDRLRPLHLMLSGLGEPFLCPDIDTMVRAAAARGIKVNLTTNGILLKPHIDACIESNLDLLSVSLDAATGETYRAIRGNDHFDTICANIAALVARRKELKRSFPRVRTHFVIQKENAGEIVEFIRLSRRLGADAVYLQPLDVRALSDDRKAGLAGGMTFDGFIDGLAEARREAEKLKMPSNLPYLIDYARDFWKAYENRHINRVTCLLPWISAYITVDGTVRPCCSFVFTGHDQGNLFADDFSKIWNAPGYRDIRSRIRGNTSLPGPCRDCVTKDLTYALRLRAVAPGFGSVTSK